VEKVGGKENSKAVKNLAYFIIHVCYSGEEIAPIFKKE
jgi:hypothetical protein